MKMFDVDLVTGGMMQPPVRTVQLVLNGLQICDCSNGRMKKAFKNKNSLSLFVKMPLTCPFGYVNLVQKHMAKLII